MTKTNNSSLDKLKNLKKDGLLLLLFILSVVVACQGALEDGNPFGPSITTVRIIPSSVNVNQGADFTFTTLGGTTPYSWSSGDLTVGTIVAGTGVFTAGTIARSVTITVVDAVGDTATAVATVMGIPLGFDVTGATQGTASTASTVTVNANGSTTGLTASIANNSSSSTYTTLPTLVTTATTIVVTSPATLPNSTQGDQVFTVTVTDNGNNNSGTFTYTLQNDGT